MHPLTYELRAICQDGSPIQNPEGAASAIAIAEIAPDGMKKAMCEKTAAFILPARPDNMEFSRDNFWSAFRAKFIWRKLWMGSDLEKDNAAAWLKVQRETAQRRGQQWPPKPAFRPKVSLPIPWDGIKERPGRMPRDGK